MEGFKTIHGLWFPEGMPDALCELKIWKHWREPEYADCTEKEPWNCFWRAIYALIPRKEFVRHEWSAQHVYDWTTEDFVLTWGCASSGKAQPLDSTVYTPGGPRRIGDLSVGEFVLDHSGAAVRVKDIHEVGIQPEYKVVFSDGAEVACAGTHLWEVGLRRAPDRTRQIVPAEELSRCAEPRTFSVSRCGELRFSPRKVFIRPYTMGVLLGDGSFAVNGQLRLSAAEPEISGGVASELDSGYVLRELPGKKNDFLLTKRSRKNGGANLYIRELKRYGLYGGKSFDKFVPDDYKYGSVSARKDVLAGLMDADGTCGKLGALTFSSVSPRLAEDVVFLVRSLGGIASVSTRQPFYRAPSGEKKKCQTSYSVHFRVPDNSFLFRCSRKRARLVAPTKMKGRSILRVEPTGRRLAMRCITLDNSRGLYVTDGCVLTHNSNDYGLLSVIDWMVDPKETVTILASTSVNMLKIRSYESVLRYFQLIKAHAPWQMPGKLRKTDDAIILDEDDELGATTDKASIRGVAVAEGTDTEARAKLQGAHLPYVRLILDELSQMKPAAMKVRTNLSIGARDFKLVGLCNPDSFTDLAAQYSVPLLPGGFAAVDPETTIEWRS